MPGAMNTLVVASVLLIQGCASSGAVMNPSRQQELKALNLFAPDGVARFSLYVDCTSDSVNCVNVGNAFSDWASDHRVLLHRVNAGDQAFASVRTSIAADAGLPYRVAIDYRPTIVAGYAMNSYGHGSQSFPPTVGYSATISITDAATGTLLERLPVHAQQTTAQGETANPYVRSEVRDLLDSLGPKGP